MHYFGDRQVTLRNGFIIGPHASQFVGQSLSVSHIPMLVLQLCIKFKFMGKSKSEPPPFTSASCSAESHVSYASLIRDFNSLVILL